MVIVDTSFQSTETGSVGEDNERGASFGVDEQCPIVSMLNFSPCTVKVAHLNVRIGVCCQDGFTERCLCKMSAGAVPHYINPE